jgi:hypothetical protein
MELTDAHQEQPSTDPYADVGRLLLDVDQFAETFFRVKLWDKPREMLESVDNNQRTIVPACHASSKTHTGSVAALRWNIMHLNETERVEVVITGPTWTQVKAMLWSEIHGRLESSRIRLPRASTTMLQFSQNNKIRGLSTNRGVNFRGWHGFILVIIDEGTGVEDEIYNEVEGMMAGGDVRELVLGNPTVSSGSFYKACHEERHKWNVIQIGALDIPNVARLMPRGVDPLSIEDGEMLDRLKFVQKHHPGVFHRNPLPYLLTPEWVVDHEDWFHWEDPQWAPKVMGRFPAAGEGQLISMDWCEKARYRDAREDQAEDADKIDVGIDASGEGNAETVLAERQGDRLLKLHVWPGSGRKHRGKAIAVIRELEEQDRLGRINVDADGVGEAMVAALLDAGFQVNEVHVGVPAQGRNKKLKKKAALRYLNYKAQLAWGLRELMQGGRFAWALEGPVLSKAISQFTSILWELNEKGQIAIEKKKVAAKRAIPSPDIFEAIMLAFAEPVKKGIETLEPVHY